jgi:SAM-dependent methyltransferase
MHYTVPVLESLLPFLRDPVDQRPLKMDGDALVSESGTRYPVIDGIPRLLTPTKTEEEENVRRKMQAFYEQFTFPGYDGIDSPGVLMDKAKKSNFGVWVDRAIPPMATVLEVGCGTGQMTNFLGMVTTRTVIGVDQSVASLTLGNTFKNRFGINNVHFAQGNIFAMPIAEQSMDVVICSGVLHHTPDPKGGYERLLKLVKPGGYILIGLYNSYARIPLGLRKLLFGMTGRGFHWLDAHLRRRDVDDSKKNIWFMDQYKNPHESWHSVDEVLKWFDQTGVQFMSGVPAIAGAAEGEENSSATLTTGGLRLFAPHPRGSAFEHVMRQLGWMFTISGEGGLYVLVGKKS